MYRNCIFCSADLKANDALERFPVGRSIAFDGEKGRLWAICPKCARWNLAPIEERWEAVEDAERLFRDTRTRAQSENIGLAKLKDGTRLVRVGRAVPGELALWRYGESLVRRRWRSLVPATVGGIAFYGHGLMAAATGVGMIYLASLLGSAVVGRIHGSLPVYRVAVPGADARTARILVRRRHIWSAHLAPGEEGVELHFPEIRREPEGRRFSGFYTEPLVLRGHEARMAMARTMTVVNARGGSRADLNAALGAIQSAGSPAELLLSTARQRLCVTGAPETNWRKELRSLGTWEYWNTPLRDQTHSYALRALALEMSLHEETERRALEGELAGLEAMWREAEEIASIADRLPDDLPAGEPPRLR